MKKFFLLIITCMVSFIGTAQTGSIKVFSEIQGVTIYLNDSLAGVDNLLLNKVQIGNHYLKIQKENVIVYSELILVKENEVTTVLVKDSKEIQDKILASKYAEQQKYKEQKLDIMINTRYVTQTSGSSETKGGAVNVFPGYYAVSGKTESTTISTTYSVTDWFLVQGSTRISEERFAEITNNQAVINAYKQRSEDVIALNHKKALNSRIGAGIAGPLIGGLGGLMIYGGLNSDKGSPGQVMGIAFGSIIAGSGAALLIQSIVMRTEKWNTHKNWVGNLSLISFEDAEKQITIYNQNLKKELGLPIDYEPNK